MGIFEDIGYTPSESYSSGWGLFESIGYEPDLPLYEEEEPITPIPTFEEEEASLWSQVRSGIKGAAILAEQVPTMFTATIPNVFYQAVQRGPDTLVDKTFLDKWITENKQERERARTLTPEEREKTWYKIPFTDKKVTFGDAEDAADSIGYSLANMAVTFVAQKVGKAVGAPLGPVGSTIAGITLGFAAGTAVMQGTSKAMFLDMARDEFLAKHKGEEITPDLEADWQKLREQLDSDADWYGFWEAAPETAGSLLTLGIAKLPVGKLLPAALKKKMANATGKSIAKAVGIPVAKLGAMLTEEQMMETITQKKQSEIEFRAGLRDKPLSYAEAFNEVLPMVLTTTPILGGVAGVITTPARHRAEREAQRAAGLPVEKELLEEELPPAPLPAFAPEIFQAIELTPEMQREIDAFEQSLTDAEKAEAEVARRRIEQAQVDRAVEEERVLTPEQFARISPRYEEAAIEEEAGLKVREAARLKRPGLDQVINKETGEFVMPTPVSDTGYQENKRLINTLIDHFQKQEIEQDVSQIPVRYQPAFNAMQDELRGAEPRRTAVVGQIEEKKRIIVTPTTYPAWFTEKFDIGDTDAEGKSRPYQFSIKDFNSVLDKLYKGKELTARQNLMYDRIKNVAEDMRALNPDVYIQGEVDALEAEGFEIMAGNMPIAEFELGDQIAIQETGGPVEKYRLMAENDGRGNAILSNPQDRRVLDTFDMLPVVGVKRANYWQNIYDMGGTGKLEAARERSMLAGAQVTTLEPGKRPGEPEMYREGVERRLFEGRESAWSPAFRETILTARGQDLDTFIKDGKNKIEDKDPIFLQIMTRYGKKIDKDTPVTEALKIVHARIVGGIEPMKLISEMIEAEKDAFIVSDFLTGLRNKYAFEIEDVAVEDWDNFAAIDLDGLKAINDTLGHAAGDAMLIEFGEAMRESGLDSKHLYHVSGDEYWVGHDDGVAILNAVIKMEKYLNRNGITVYDEGQPTTYKIGFNYGTGKTRAQAEKTLRQAKDASRREGKGTERGYLPEILRKEFSQGQRVGPKREAVPGAEVKPIPTPIPIPLKIETKDIPADLTVKVKMIHDRTGKIITADKNAKEALRSVNSQIESYYTLLGCLG